MRLRLLKRLGTCAILLLYVLVPLLDSMVCAECMDHASFQCETTIGHLQAPHGDMIYAAHTEAPSKTSAPGDQAAKCFCPICANVRMGVEVFSPNVNFAVAQWDGPSAAAALSEFHSSIDKPPQNLLV
jgi:hypothetical protein